MLGIPGLFPFVSCDSLQDLTYPLSVKAGVAGFERKSLLESGSSSLQLSADVACNQWLLVGICTYGHCGDDVVDALINEASD